MEAPQRQLPLARGVEVLATQDGLVALYKPGGIRSHPNRSGIDSHSLLQAPYDSGTEAYQVDAEPVYLLHRLDGPTSGVIVLCWEVGLAATIRQQFVEHRVQKTYWAIVKGSHPRLKQTWRDRLKTHRAGGAMRTMVSAQGEAALCQAHALSSASQPIPLTLLELRPATGRTHQLRVQAAHRRMPILGDATYGDFALNRSVARTCGYKGLFLHARRIQLDYEVDGQGRTLDCTAEPPALFHQLFPK